MLIERAKALGVFKSLFTVPMETIDPANLPAIAVFLIEEVMASDGNAGEPHFIHTVTYGLQAIIQSSDAEEQRKRIISVLGKLDMAILTDPKMLMPVEEIQNITRRFRFERVSEVPIAQFNSAFRLTFRSRWAPYVPDDYLVLHIETAFPIGGDTSSVEQIKAVWEIEQN